jgi:hypothetical protein
MSSDTPLSTSKRDIVAAVARGTLGAIPVVGAAVAEVVDHFIPGQKLDRVVAFIEEVAIRVEALAADHTSLRERLHTPEGADLLEEGIVQASRAISADRRRRIASIVVNGIVENDLRYDRTRKLLAIINSLTDSEILLLTYYEQTPTLGYPDPGFFSSRPPPAEAF